MSYMAGQSMTLFLVTILLVLQPLVRCDDAQLIPPDKAKVEDWFKANVGGITAQSATLDPALTAAEATPSTIKVMADGSGDFKTISEAVASVPEGNTKRVIISIGPGNFTEKISVNGTRPFITMIGDPKGGTFLLFNGDAKKYGTVYSATLTIDVEHFVGVNLNIVNTSPRPDGIDPDGKDLAQAVVLRVGGDKCAFYNCKLYGFQDTLCDIAGNHFFKDCYIEGTVDFIFGSGQSIYLNCEIHVIPGDLTAIITAQARRADTEPGGYILVHCSVTGSGGNAVLGRTWFPYPRVVFAYCDISDVIKPEGWSNNNNPATEKTAIFGEYNNVGPGAALDKRVPFCKKLGDADVAPYLSLGFIEGSKWLLPPPQ